MLNNPDYRDLLRCRSQTTSENDNGFSDNFDGQLYKDLQLQGLFHGDYDIALGLFIDDFDVGGNKFTIVHGIVFNLPPTARYQWHNVSNVPLYLVNLKPRREPEYEQKWFFGSNLFYVSFEDHTFALIYFHEAAIEGDSNKSTVYVTASLMNKKIWIVW
ncbi:hypothetical protein Unana1_06662 [Umbelopsis nana]